MFENIFILPIKKTAESIYLFIYALISDYGISLIVLSFVSSFLMILLLKFLIQFAERETKVQKILTPQLSKFRQESKGQVRYNRIVKLYKRYNYHPVLALRSLIPVLVQLPFLFAAYFMLSDLKNLHGQSFLFIRDLGAPDSILWGINLLPFLMTGINIAAAIISKEFNFREKVQAGIIAVLFLILLYNRNAALLIFWTMNNIILLTRTILKQVLGKLLIFPELSGYFKKILVFLKKNPVYPFVIGIYPVLYLYNFNIADTSFHEVLVPFFVNAIGTVVLFGIVYLFFRDKFKAALFSTISMIALFYYKYSLFKIAGKIGISNYHLVFIWLFLLALVFILLNYFSGKKKLLEKANPFINLIICVIFFILCIQILSYHVSKVIQAKSKSPDTITGEDMVSGSEFMPDIYYIILDGYGSNSSLSAYYNFDNSAFTDALIKKDFYIAGKSKSNYSTTFLSFCSSLNMEYVQDLGLNLDSKSKNRDKIYSAIEKNKVLGILKGMGYKYIHFQTGWGAINKTADITYRSESGEFIVLWINTSILYPIIRRLGITDDLRQNKLNTFKQLAAIREMKYPKFIFCHIVLPHPPYLFGANGEKVTGSDVQFTGHVWLQKDKYLNQLKFTNTKVIELLEIMLGDRTYNPVIIIQGDHGSASTIKDWENPVPANIDERMSILNAYYMPEKKYSAFYDSISPVNSFRVIFNTIFNYTYPVLQDKIYFSSYIHPYKFQ